MKNLLKGALLVMLMAIGLPSHSNDLSSTVNRTTGSGKMDEAESRRLLNRLEEINAMDKESMTRSEKRELRKEVKAIKKSMDSSGGVYLSVGAVILIIVLLILLL